MSDAGNVSGMPDLIEKMNELINYIQNAVMVAVKNFIAEVNSVRFALKFDQNIKYKHQIV